jgi:hypothetical protein
MTAPIGWRRGMAWALGGFGELVITFQWYKTCMYCLNISCDVLVSGQLFILVFPASSAKM